MSKDLEIIGLKKRVRNLRILLLAVIVVALGAFAMDFFLSLLIYSDYQKEKALTNTMAKDIDGLYYENEKLRKKLSSYEVDEDYLEGLGATEDQAAKIIKASLVHNVDPKY